VLRVLRQNLGNRARHGDTAAAPALPSMSTEMAAIENRFFMISSIRLADERSAPPSRGEVWQPCRNRPRFIISRRVAGSSRERVSKSG
jgi:hypothetical protein